MGIRASDLGRERSSAAVRYLGPSTPRICIRVGRQSTRQIRIIWKDEGSMMMNFPYILLEIPVAGIE